MCGCNKNKAAAQAAVQAIAVAYSRQVPTMRTETVPVIVAPSLTSTDTSVWGAPLWKALHIAAHHTKYKAQILTWKRLLDSLRSGLPCPDCSSHYNGWYRSHELRFSMFPAGFQNTVISWLLALHNNVNTRLGRPTWSISQLNDVYGGSRAEMLAEGRRTLETLNGIIGKQSYDLLMSLLH